MFKVLGKKRYNLEYVDSYLVLKTVNITKIKKGKC